MGNGINDARYVAISIHLLAMFSPLVIDANSQQAEQRSKGIISNDGPIFFLLDTAGTFDLCYVLNWQSVSLVLPPTDVPAACH